jgi:hypothetical protein
MRARAVIALWGLAVSVMTVGACGGAEEAPGGGTGLGSESASVSPSHGREPDFAEPDASSTTTTTQTTAVVTTTDPPAPAPSASAVNGNLSVEATIAAATVWPSEFLEFTAHVEDADADKVRVVWEFGDGTQTRLPGEPAVCATEPSTRPLDATDRQRHAYRHPGRYRVVLHVVTGPQQCLSEPSAEQVTLELEVRVSDAVAHSNGPESANVRFGQDRGAEDGSVTMFASALEYDGYLIRAVIDWGDGTRVDTFERTMQACQDPGRSWPASTWAPSPLTHRYEHEGAFTVTITFISTGCDGLDEQSTSATAEAHPGRVQPS